MPALFVELTLSNARDGAVVALTLTAGPPVALTLATPPAGTVTVPALLSTNAPVAPEVVVSDRSVPLPSPKVVVPVVLTMLTPPLVEPTVVRSLNVLVDMFVPVADRAGPPFVVVTVVEPKSVVPALLSRMPVALLLTARLVTLNVPVVPLSSRPGPWPAVPTPSTTLMSSSIPPPVSPAPRRWRRPCPARRC